MMEFFEALVEQLYDEIIVKNLRIFDIIRRTEKED
jgi:hypothetical protein